MVHNDLDAQLNRQESNKSHLSNLNVEGKEKAQSLGKSLIDHQPDLLSDKDSAKDEDNLSEKIEHKLSSNSHRDSKQMTFDVPLADDSTLVEIIEDKNSENIS